MVKSLYWRTKRIKCAVAKKKGKERIKKGVGGKEDKRKAALVCWKTKIIAGGGQRGGDRKKRWKVRNDRKQLPRKSVN